MTLSRGLVDLGREYEIALRESVYFVGPNFHSHFAPREIDIGVMALLFGDRAHFVREIERRLEIRELEFPFNMVTADHVPMLDFSGQRFDLFGGQRRHSP